MNIFIIKDGLDTGPFTWGEVFIMLNNGSLSLDAPGRIEPDGEVLPLSEFHLWGEGDEVGPFTWEDIEVMLREGLLDFDIQARFEEENEPSRLGEVAAKSKEIEFVPQGKAAHGVPHWFESLCAAFQARSSAFYLKWGLTAVVLLCLVAGIFQFASRPPKASIVEVTVEVIEPEPLESAPVNGDMNPTENPISASITPLSEQESPVAAIPQPEPEPDTNDEQEKVPESQTAPPTVVESSVPENPTITEPTPSPAPVPQMANSVPAAKQTPKPAQAVSVADFFKMETIKLLRKPGKDGIGVWTVPMRDGKPGEPIFNPSLEVKVSTRENTRSDKIFAKAYFFDDNNKLTAKLESPSKAGPNGKSDFSAPILFYKNKPDRLFFAVPSALEKSNWKALIVFGDKHEAQVMVYPPTASAFLLDYPEKALVETKAASRITRRPAMDPLIEHVVKTKNPRMPQMTLFLRPPKGITDPSEVQGVLAICVLAGGLDEMRRELQKEEMPGDYAGLFSFANKHKLAILAWGSRGLWDAGRNYDELSKEKAKELDESFDLVSSAWARGVNELGDKYGIPQKNFLLWGNCGSAQFAARLCLRKPEYFLAVHIHMPGSYDKPTPEASKVLWCLTIGEMEGGYERSKKWVKAARDAGYPILYKAIPGLGHAGHPDAAALGFEFFEFAMAQKAKREELEEELASKVIFPSSNPTLEPWLEEFRKPAFYGDFVNQEIFPPDEIDMIPVGFRTSIPTKRMATIWMRSK